MRLIRAAAGVTLALLAGCATARGGHAPVNGIRMYHEIHGPADGVPLVLLHGGGSTIEVTFGKALPLLARGRRVIAVEEQGHGRTSQREGPIRFETSADDVVALLDHLGIARADFFGFSNGASVALHAALRHPDRVRKLVFASAFTKRSGAPAAFWEFMATADFSNMPPPLKDAFLKVNPDPAALRVMHDKDAERMRSFKDLPDDALRALRAPTLVVIGDRDIVTHEHAAEIVRLIPGARLMVVPGGHGDWLGEAVMSSVESPDPALALGWIERFLSAP